MNNVDVIELSLEQTAEVYGDPTRMIFERMYKKFPELCRFQEANNDWEHYMMQEIIENLMHYAQSPEAALMTVKDMVSHHELIGVSRDVFKGMYETLLESIPHHFYGPNREAMVSLWQQTVAEIVDCIDCSSLYLN